MKKLFNLILVIALAIGFVSCDKSEWPDSKYQSKLVGEWSLSAITMSSEFQSASVSIPNPEMGLDAVVFNLKRGGTCVISMTSQGVTQSLNGTYQVSDGKFLLTTKYENDYEVETETTSFDIEDVSGKKLVLKIIQPLEADDPSLAMDILLEFTKI